MSEPSAPARTLLAGRYRLVSIVSAGACTTLWRAHDEVLARPIAVKVLHAPGAVPRCADLAEAVTLFTSSATSVGRLTHPRIASTYDAGVDGDTPYIVTEWVDGDALADAVARDGPLPAAQAHTVGVQTAAALAYAHDNGIPHGQLDGFNVLLCADGNVKLTDFGVASALAPDADGAADGGRTERRSPAGQDVRAAAAVLYLCLTGRSVNGAEPALPAAPRKDGVLLSPQQVRAGVPRELDAVVMRTLGDSRRTGPPITDSAQLAAALAEVRPPDPVPAVTDDQTVVELVPVEGQPSRLLRVAAPAVLAGIVVIAVLAAIVIGGRDRTPRRTGTGSPAARTASGAQSGSASTSAGESAADAGAPALTIAGASDFDPQGSPASENPKKVPLAYDGDPSTSWDTDRYKTASFGLLKGGVGLVFDLGQPVSVSRVVVTFADPGTSLELRAADAPGATSDAFAPMASAADATTTAALTPGSTAPHRYWLVWLTKLPAISGGYKARVSEVAFRGLSPR